MLVNIQTSLTKEKQSITDNSLSETLKLALTQVENQVHEITLRRPSTILKAQPIQDLKYENPFRKEEEVSIPQTRKIIDK
jgi:hypothetical protein